jgi:hypothetical protein
VLPNRNGAERCAIPRAPRPVAPQSPIVSLQMKPRLYPSLDERWGLGPLRSSRSSLAANCQSDTVIICQPALHRAHNNIVAITIAPIRAKTGWLRAGYPLRSKEVRKLPRGHCYEGTRRANSARSTSFQLIAYARTIASLAG